MRCCIHKLLLRSEFSQLRRLPGWNARLSAPLSAGWIEPLVKASERQSVSPWKRSRCITDRRHGGAKRGTVAEHRGPRHTCSFVASLIARASRFSKRLRGTQTTRLSCFPRTRRNSFRYLPQGAHSLKTNVVSAPLPSSQALQRGIKLPPLRISGLVSSDIGFIRLNAVSNLNRLRTRLAQICPVPCAHSGHQR
jgi:hypothetical protein